jgi:hypothetical protein
MKTICIVAVMLAALMGGCAATPKAPPTAANETAPPAEPPAEKTGPSWVFYPINRLLDLFDMVRANVGVGPGFGGNIRVTKVVQASFENYLTARAGLKKRTLPVYLEADGIYGLSLATIGGKDAARQFTEIGLTLHLLVISLDVAVVPEEIADFLLGFFTIDFEDDDWGKKRKD